MILCAVLSQGFGWRGERSTDATGNGRRLTGTKGERHLSAPGNELAVPASLAARVRGDVELSRRERIFDLALAILMLPVVLAACAVISIALYLDSPGPVIFRSTRVGRDGHLFSMLKFRKMRPEATGPAITVADDERFTPIGRFLAAARLDELPQIWNVLRGDMRFVGPRPELECFVAEFADAYAEILTVTPGITGVAQLQFLRESALVNGDDPVSKYTDHVLPQKIEIDVEYVRSRSLRGDLLILARTVVAPLVLLAEGARSRIGNVRAWLPAAGLGLVLALLLALSAGNIS